MNFLPFLIAKRLYFNQNNTNKLKTLIILSKIGIFISVFILMLSLSALNGFNILLNRTVLSSFPHGIIQLTDSSCLTWEEIVKQVKLSPEIRYAEPYIIKNGLLTHNNTIQMVEIKSFKNIKYLKNHFLDYTKIKLSKKKNNIILSSHLARKLSIKSGDFIKLIILNKETHSIESNLKYFSLKVIGIFQENGIFDSNLGYIPFDFFKYNLAKEDVIHQIELYMYHPFNANQNIVNAVQKIHRPLLLYTWINDYKYIYHDISIIKIVVYLSLFFLIIISCFSIASISLMMVSKKSHEIAILRSIGANNFLIKMIFLYYGMRSIIISTVTSLAFSIVSILQFEKILFYLNKLSNNLLLDNLYYKNFFLLELHWLDICMIFSITLIIGMITNLYPAHYASNINPSIILKEY